MGVVFYPFLKMRIPYKALEPPLGHPSVSEPVLVCHQSTPGSVSAHCTVNDYNCSPLLGHNHLLNIPGVQGLSVTPVVTLRGLRRWGWGHREELYLACWADGTFCSGRPPPAHSAPSCQSWLPAAPCCPRSPRPWSRASRGWHPAHVSALCCCDALTSRSYPLPRTQPKEGDVRRKVRKESCLYTSIKLKTNKRKNRIVQAAWRMTQHAPIITPGVLYSCQEFDQRTYVSHRAPPS